MEVKTVKISSVGVKELVSTLLADEWSDDEDEEEEEEEEADGELGDETEEELDEELDDDFREKVRLALGPAGCLTEDGTNLEIDDEEMFQLDEALADVFRSKFGANKEQEQYEKEKRMVRLKCVKLTKRFFKSKDTTSDMIIELLNALLEAYKKYSAPEETRIRGKIIKCLANLPAAKSSRNHQQISIGEIKDTFEKSVELCWRNTEKTVQSVCAKTCRWIISLCYYASLETNWISEKISKLVLDYFTKPNCCISKQFILSLLLHEKVLDLSVIEILASQAFSKVRPFKQLSGISLLYFCIKTIPPSSELNSYLTSIESEIITALIDAVTKKKVPLINELFQLASVISKHITLDVSPENIKLFSEIPKKIKKKLYRSSKNFLRSMIASPQDMAGLKSPKNPNVKSKKKIKDNGANSTESLKTETMVDEDLPSHESERKPAITSQKSREFSPVPIPRVTISSDKLSNCLTEHEDGLITQSNVLL